MEIKTPKPEIKEEKRILIYNPLKKIDSKTNLDVMRIELDDKFTRIDFVHYASRVYDNGGWIQIHSCCYIKPVGSGIQRAGTDLKLKMTRAVNITVAPVKHYYKSKKDRLYYTLYFPPLPKDTKSIDIIEMETSDPSFFNFYGVSMEKVRSEIIVVPN